MSFQAEEYLFDEFEYCSADEAEYAQEVYEPYITYDQEFEAFEDEQFARAYCMHEDDVDEDYEDDY